MERWKVAISLVQLSMHKCFKICFMREVYAELYAQLEVSVPAEFSSFDYTVTAADIFTAGRTYLLTLRQYAPWIY